MANTESAFLRVEHLQMYFPIYRGLLSKKVGDVKAVDDISFSIEEGRTFGLVGESGCGKTTAGKCILRINNPTGGTIHYRGIDITHMTDRELAPYRREIQLIFQDPYGSLDPRQSLFSIVKEAITSDRKPHTAGEIRSRVNELLTLVELDPGMSDRYPHELSGGQRQRLGIARALACEPRLIVCDEPVSALDVSIQAQIINLFSRLQRQLGLTYLFIAHDLAVVRHIADRVGVMYLGHLVEIMDADELYRHPMHPYTRAAFGRADYGLLCRAVAPARGARGRGAKPHSRPHRLPVPPALPARDGGMPARYAGADRPRRRPPRRLPQRLNLRAGSRAAVCLGACRFHEDGKRED